MAPAKYQQIADRLRDQIDVGTLQPGDRLPSEPDLVRQFDASRNTVRLALAALTNQGLVVTRQGLGTFVTEPARPFTALLSRITTQPSVQSTSTFPEVGNVAEEPEASRQVVEKSPASVSVAEKLEIKAGDLVVVRRRSAAIGEVPWMMMASYFPMDIAADTPLEQAGDITVGSIKLLEDLGYPQAGFIDEIGARMPSAREFSFFGLSTGTPVVVVNRTAYTQERPIRMTRYIYRADRVRLTHEVGSIPARYRSS
jgi:GntR family transcriptional regulator